MPQKTQTISINGFPEDSVLALAYGTLESLNWNIKYARENIIIAYTPKTWKRYDQEITVQASAGAITVTSKMIHGEAFDMMGRNKKFLNDFTTALEKVRSTANEQQIETWKEKVVGLKGATIREAQEQARQSAEVDRVMNLSKGNMNVTYVIIGINVLVFLAMVFSGVSFMEPSGLDIIRWGANYSPLTLSGDWWRLITCVFVHVGIIHILFNMYALYIIGVYLEPMLGKVRYTVAYLATGIFASLASIWWHSDPVPSAGASGAIFGMYGVFLALLSTKLIPGQVRNKLLQSIAIFVGYNLVYGMKSGVDNSAHVGGLLSGVVIGYLYFISLKGKRENKKSPVIAGFVAVLAVAAAYLYLEQHTVSASERNMAQQTLSDVKFKDAQKFVDQYNSFVDMQDTALAPLKDTTQLMDATLANKLENISLPEWNRAEKLVNEMKTYDVSENYKNKLSIMEQYVELRKQQIGLLKEYINDNGPQTEQALKNMNEKIDSTVEKMNAIQL